MELQRGKRARALERRVLRFIQGKGLVAPGQTLVVAVSGGPDSACLLHVLHRLGPALGAGLHVAHLNHGLRGPEAPADADYVAGLARGLGLPATIEAGDVRGFRREQRCSLEEAAREVRYAFLARVAREVGAAGVAVGHTADDQAETVLMHLLRGAGLAGLRGMLPLTQWRSRRTGAQVLVVRPLLGISRQDTLAYCQALALEPRQDTSNLSSGFLRNRLRAQLLPALEQYNPQIKAALLRTARAAAEELDFLQMEVCRAWPRVVREGEGGLVLDKGAFQELAPALRRHLLLSAVQPWLGGRREAQYIEALLAAVDKPPGTRLTLPGGLILQVNYQDCYLGPPPDPPLPPLEGEHPFHVPGEAWLAGWHLRGRVLAPPLPQPPAQGWQAHLDLEAVGSELVLRRRRPGDKFHPLGLGQPKRLQDFLVEAKVPGPWRDRVPLICGRGGIAWVAGWRIAHWARVTPATRSILHLELARA